MASPQRPRPANRGIGWTLAALVAIVLLIWLFWGFRWPPTTAVMEDEEEVVPEVGRSVEPIRPAGAPVWLA